MMMANFVLVVLAVLVLSINSVNKVSAEAINGYTWRWAKKYGSASDDRCYGTASHTDGSGFFVGSFSSTATYESANVLTSAGAADG